MLPLRLGLLVQLDFDFASGVPVADSGESYPLGRHPLHCTGATGSLEEIFESHEASLVHLRDFRNLILKIHDNLDKVVERHIERRLRMSGERVVRYLL